MACGQSFEGKTILLTFLFDYSLAEVNKLCSEKIHSNCMNAKW